MKIFKSLSLFFVLFIVSKSALALREGECNFTNQKLTYSGVDLPSLDAEYKDGEILGKLTLSADYECNSYRTTSYYTNTYNRIGAFDGDDSYLGNNRFKSNTEGIIFESPYVATASDIPDQFHFLDIFVRSPIIGSLSVPIFDVIKSGEISAGTSAKLNLEKPFYLGSYFQSGYSPYSLNKFAHSVPDSSPVPVVDATCSLEYPPNIDVPALIPGVRTEVSSRFNVVLNCASKAVMQNNIQLTVTPVITTGISVSGDKSSLLYNSGGQIILMNIFNSVGGTETQMTFSTMYQFSNSSQTSSFTIPMRAKFMLGATGYGNFSFQTQLSVQYN